MALGVVNRTDGRLNLQATLASASNTTAVLAAIQPAVHHPLACTGPISYHEDDHMECPHSITPADDLRTVIAVQTSIAMLLIEEAMKL